MLFEARRRLKAEEDAKNGIEGNGGKGIEDVEFDEPPSPLVEKRNSGGIAEGRSVSKYLTDVLAGPSHFFSDVRTASRLAR